MSNKWKILFCHKPHYVHFCSKLVSFVKKYNKQSGKHYQFIIHALRNETAKYVAYLSRCLWQYFCLLLVTCKVWYTFLNTNEEQKNTNVYVDIGYTLICTGCIYKMLRTAYAMLLESLEHVMLITYQGSTFYGGSKLEPVRVNQSYSN